MRKTAVCASVALLFMPLVLTGCLFGPKQKASTAIDPPPMNVQKEDAQSVQSNQTLDSLKKGSTKTSAKLEQKKTSGLEMYFLTDSGYVVPYSLNIPNATGIAKEGMKFMVQGGPGESLLPKGFSCILPKGTQIKGLNILNGTATIDFSKEFLNYDAKDPKMEDKILSAITWTLTGFDHVKEVNIRVEGRKLDFMPRWKTPAQGLTRNRGINLEVSQGIDLTQSIPVTLYFLGQTPDNTVYYVPVTRMINRTDNVAKVALQELVKGPLQNSKLSGALDATTEVNSVQVKGDVVTVDFGDQLLQYNNDKAASKDAFDSIVLSLTENTSAHKVKIMVNGKTSVVATGKKNQKADQPVMRPKMVNPIGL